MWRRDGFVVLKSAFENFRGREGALGMRVLRCACVHASVRACVRVGACTRAFVRAYSCVNGFEFVCDTDNQ